jgi:hypothetical protein
MHNTTVCCHFVPFQSPRKATSIVPVRTATSLTRTRPSATCSTTVLTANSPKSPALQVYTSTSTRALACGRNLQDAPGAAKQKVSVVVQLLLCWGVGRFGFWSAGWPCSQTDRQVVFDFGQVKNIMSYINIQDKRAFTAFN